MGILTNFNCFSADQKCYTYVKNAWLICQGLGEDKNDVYTIQKEAYYEIEGE